MTATRALEAILGKKYVRRPVIDEALRVFDYKLEQNDSHFAIVISAPTAYGKSSCSMAMASALAEAPGALGERVIHVLPLRSIIEQLYNEAVEKISHEISVGAQAMLFLEGNSTPYMFPRLVYTTIDSFMLNLFKAPVAEAYREMSHFDVPRYVSYSSVVVFDEVHLFSSSTPSSNPEVLRARESKMFTAFLSALRALTEAGVPVVVMTATMPESYLKKILNSICGEVFVIEYDPEEGREKRLVEDDVHHIFVKDEAFRKFAVMTNADYRGMIEEDQLAETVEMLLKEARVLVVRNTVEKAVGTWQKLRKHDAVLLHGRLTAGDREKALGSANKARLLVSTQVIEAGVKLDFDALVSDAAPLGSVVQRVGRLRREGNAEDSKPTLHLIKGHGDNVYHPTLVERTVERLESLRKEQTQVAWRLPFEKEERIVNGFRVIGYKQLLEYVMNGWKYETDQNLNRILGEIDTYFAVETSDVRQILTHICSFTRESGLLPLMHLPKDLEINSMDEAYKCLLPINIDALLYEGTWKKVLAIERRNTDEVVKVAGFDYKKKQITTRFSRHLYELFTEAGRTCWLMESVNRATRELTTADKEDAWRPVGIMVNSEAYTEAGLRFP